MATPPQASLWQQWVDGTKGLLGMGGSPQPPQLPPRAADDPVRKKAAWTTAAQQAQTQIDALLATASKGLVDKALKLAGKEGAGLVGNKFAVLRQQFHDEASKTSPDLDPLKNLFANFPARIEAVRDNFDKLLATGQFHQHVQDLGVSWRKELTPALAQIDALLAPASKAMTEKAQKKAGNNDVGFVADRFSQLKKQFGDDAQKLFPQINGLHKLVTDFPARIQVLNKSLDAVLEDPAQLRQELTQRAAENDQLARQLRVDWAKKVMEPLQEMLPRGGMNATETARLKAQTDWQKANEIKFKQHGDRFEAALKAGKLSEAQEIFDDVAGARMPEALSQFKHEKDQAAYLAQMKKEASAEMNPGNQFDPKKLEEWDKVSRDLRDKTNSGLSEAEVLAIRIYTSRNYKYINPAVANQKDRKDRPKDWMDISMAPDPSKAAEILAKEHQDKNLLPPTAAEIEAKKVELTEQLKDYSQEGKKQLYEEGGLHGGMMMEAFKKMKKAGKMKELDLYRGARMTQADFDREYQVGKVMECEAFVSNAARKTIARMFASGGDEARADQTVSVMVIAHMFEAVSVDELSVNNGESEFMVMPGSKLIVEEIIEDPEGEAHKNRFPGKAPEATAWKQVKVKQLMEEVKPS